MAAAVKLRTDYSAFDLRRLAAGARHPNQGRRLLSLAAVLDGEARFRVDQVWRGLYVNAVAINDMTDLPKSLRTTLVVALPSSLVPAAESTSDNGDTIKWLWTLDGGAHIETVLMHYPGRSTVCVSTQAGCAMACGFCATGQAGFERHLTVGEIVEQVVAAQRAAGDRRVGNGGFMGIGEPLAHFHNTGAAVHPQHHRPGEGAAQPPQAAPPGIGGDRVRVGGGQQSQAMK